MIPSKTEQQAPADPEYSAVITHRNHDYNTYPRERCRKPLAGFRTTSNHCKRILENVKCSHAQTVQANFEIKTNNLNNECSGRSVTKF